MKKMNVNIFFIIDETDSGRKISKVKIGISGVGDDQSIDIPQSYNSDLLSLVKAVIGRWSNNSKEITLTSSQWTQIKAMIQAGRVK